MCRAIVPSVVLAVLLTAACPAMSQSISVTVDGSPVEFWGAKPVAAGGRVLVPLRGVFEKIGAFVDWVPETRTVVAQKGDIDVELTVGSPSAVINGKRVVLDTPAKILTGSTMVPLRFLGEALGADVRWDAGSRTVMITTAGPTEAAGGGETDALPKITSFTHDASGWLAGGGSLKVVLEGTPGGSASFHIPGVVDEVRMREARPGEYEGTWAVPRTGNLTNSGATVLGELRAKGKELLIQAADPISVDNVAPRLKDRKPEPKSIVTTTKPDISAVFDDGSGSGINPDSVKITINGADVTAKATVTRAFVTYRPEKPLPSGENAVEVSARDNAGNPVAESWKFSVRSAADAIKSFTHNASAGLQPGDVMSVKLVGEPGGKASFAITSSGKTIRTVQMQEVSAGVYEGEYTVRKGDDLSGAVIVGSLTTAAGEVFTTTAEGTVKAPAAKLEPPVVKTPAEGAKVKSPLVVTGTAAQGLQVRLKVNYATMVLGALRMTGTLAEQVVDVTEKGDFKSEPIDLSTSIKGKNTEYTLTAVAVRASGEESEPATVKFGRL